MIVSEEKGTDSGAGFVFESKEFSFGQDDVEMRRQRCSLTILSRELGSGRELQAGDGASAPLAAPVSKGRTVSARGLSRDGGLPW